MRSLFGIALLALALLPLAGCSKHTRVDAAMDTQPSPASKGRSKATDTGGDGVAMKTSPSPVPDSRLKGAYHPSDAKMEEAASARSPIVGKPAPDFTLMDQNSKPVTLASLRGQWVVIYFYPKDDTPGCACQATEFTQLLHDFKNMNAKVYGISPDPVDAHRVFITKYSLKLDLLSDPDHKVMEKYGAWTDVRLGAEQYGRVIRTTLIVGPDGLIRYHWPEVIPEGHAVRVEARLKALQAASK